MVRLLLPQVLVGELMLLSFQSHNGAIAARTAGDWLFINSRFNPTMVRLLQGRDAFATVLETGFNPTMVRLLLAGDRSRGLAKFLFQSHNGAIAA